MKQDSATQTYECSWCKMAGLDVSEYVRNGKPEYYDKDTGLPICDDCADNGR